MAVVCLGWSHPDRLPLRPRVPQGLHSRTSIIRPMSPPGIRLMMITSPNSQLRSCWTRTLQSWVMVGSWRYFSTSLLLKWKAAWSDALSDAAGAFPYNHDLLCCKSLIIPVSLSSPSHLCWAWFSQGWVLTALNVALVSWLEKLHYKLSFICKLWFAGKSLSHSLK